MTDHTYETAQSSAIVPRSGPPARMGVLWREDHPPARPFVAQTLNRTYRGHERADAVHRTAQVAPARSPTTAETKCSSRDAYAIVQRRISDTRQCTSRSSSGRADLQATPSRLCAISHTGEQAATRPAGHTHRSVARRTLVLPQLVAVRALPPTPSGTHSRTSRRPSVRLLGAFVRLSVRPSVRQEPTASRRRRYESPRPAIVMA